MSSSSESSSDESSSSSSEDEKQKKKKAEEAKKKEEEEKKKAAEEAKKKEAAKKSGVNSPIHFEKKNCFDSLLQRYFTIAKSKFYEKPLLWNGHFLSACTSQTENEKSMGMSAHFFHKSAQLQYKCQSGFLNEISLPNLPVLSNLPKFLA